MGHTENSVHGKLDLILLNQESHDIRLRNMEEAVVGSTEKIGLCEKVRTLQRDNAKQTAIISTSISAIFIAGWAYIKQKMGI